MVRKNSNKVGGQPITFLFEFQPTTEKELKEISKSINKTKKLKEVIIIDSFRWCKLKEAIST